MAVAAEEVSQIHFVPSRGGRQPTVSLAQNRRHTLQKSKKTAPHLYDGWSDDNASVHYNSEDETARIHHPRQPLSRGVLSQKDHVLDECDDDGGGFEEDDPLPDLVLAAVQDNPVGAGKNSSIVSLHFAPLDDTAGTRSTSARRVPLSQPAGAHLVHTPRMLVDTPQPN